MRWIVDVKTQIRLTGFEAPEDQISSSARSHDRHWFSNGCTNDFSPVTLAPCLADVDLLFAVVLVVELDDAVGKGEDSLAGPKNTKELKMSQDYLLLAVVEIEFFNKFSWF